MQRPRVVKITSLTANNEADEPVTARVEQEQASAPSEGQTEAPAEKEPEQAENGRKTRNMKAATAALIERGRNRCRKAIESGDPEQFLRDEGLSNKVAYERLRRWKQLYPDLFEGVELPQKRRGRKAKEATEPEETERPEEAAESEDDEISLVDFLADYGGTEMQEQACVAQEGPKNSDPMLDAMNVRCEELRAEKERLMAEKKRIEAEIERIEAQQEALEICLSAFRGKEE